jgi:hypothetical protein
MMGYVALADSRNRSRKTERKVTGVFNFKAEGLNSNERSSSLEHPSAPEGLQHFEYRRSSENLDPESLVLVKGAY